MRTLHFAYFYIKAFGKVGIYVIKVAKFGGSSLANADCIKRAAAIAESDGSRRYIVVSAPGKMSGNEEKVTDMLISAYNEKGGEREKILYRVIERFEKISKELGVRCDVEKIFDMAEETEYDRFISRGEYGAAVIFSKYISCPMVDAAELIMFDPSGKLDMDESLKRIFEMSKRVERAVIPGFYGSNGEKIVTLSRGGSDISGAIVASAVDADVYENWTDVDGIMMADPKIINVPRQIKKITYDRLALLSSTGATVLHRDAIEPVLEKGVPIQIKNTFSPMNEGSFVVSYENDENERIAGVSGKGGCTLLYVRRLPADIPELLFRLGNVGNGIHLMVCGDSLTAVFTENMNEQERRELLFSLCSQGCQTACIEDETAILTVTGKDLTKTGDTASSIKMALDDSGIRLYGQNIDSVSGNIFFYLDERDLDRAMVRVYNTIKL